MFLLYSLDAGAGSTKIFLIHLELVHFFEIKLSSIGIFFNTIKFNRPLIIAIFLDLVTHRPLSNQHASVVDTFLPCSMLQL